MCFDNIVLIILCFDNIVVLSLSSDTKSVWLLMCAWSFRTHLPVMCPTYLQDFKPMTEDWQYFTSYYCLSLCPSITESHGDLNAPWPSQGAHTQTHTFIASAWWCLCIKSLWSRTSTDEVVMEINDHIVAFKNTFQWTAITFSLGILVPKLMTFDNFDESLSFDLES